LSSEDVSKLLTAIFGRTQSGFVAVTAVPGQEYEGLDDAWAAGAARNGFIPRPDDGVFDSTNWDETKDWYLCPALLSQRRRQKVDVVESSVLWVDFDYPVDLSKLNPVPSLAVASSAEHRHAYWLLDRPVTADLLEEYNKRLEKAHNGDSSGWDAIQLLRLPCGVNSKRGDGFRPHLVLHEPERLYSLEAFSHLPELSEIERSESQILASGEFPDLDFDREEVLLRLGAQATPKLLGLINHRSEKHKRSEPLYKCIAECQRLDITEDDVFRLIYDMPVDKWVDSRSRHAKDLWQDIRRTYTHIKSKQQQVETAGDTLLKLQEMRKLKIPQNERLWKLATLVVQDMEQRGLFIRTIYDELFYLDSQTGVLYAIDKDNAEYADLLLRWYMVYERGDEFGGFLQHIRTQARIQDPSPVHRLAHYDVTNGLLYVSSFDNHFWKLDGKNMTRHPNGTYGVVFVTDRKAIPYRLDPEVPGTIDRLVFGSANYAPQTQGTTREHLVHVLRTWVASMFFRSLMPTKPLLLVTGPAGSGKSSLLQAIARLIYGPHAGVSSVPKSERDFGRVASGRDLVFFDNADSTVESIEDLMAQSATGGTYDEGQHYVNMGMVERELRAFIGITSRVTDFVSREDLADRLLVLHVEKGTDGVEHLQRRLVEQAQYRNQMWSELLGYLNQLVWYIKEHGWRPPPTDFRLADYAAMLWLTSAVSGFDSEQIIQGLQSSQRETAASANPVVFALVELMENPNHVDAWHVGRFWYDQMASVLSTHGDLLQTFKHQVTSARVVKKHLTGTGKLLEDAGYRMVQRDGQTGSTEFKFERIN
jgi:energy-coupling factor transporter ATP-binding protein EcfA2